jgi:hypothetical protein
MTFVGLQYSLFSYIPLSIPMDYSSGIEEANRIINENSRTIPNRRLIIFLGSSIGNFEPDQATSFIYMLKERMTSEQDQLLIGFDLQKNVKVLSMQLIMTRKKESPLNITIPDQQL